MRNNTTLDPFDHVRLRRGAEHLHDLGKRALYEFLDEIGHHNGCEHDILARLDRWRETDIAMLRAAGGDRFPPRLQAVPS